MIDERNKRRVIRLIENDGVEPSRKPMRSDALILGLAVDRQDLERRIDSRVDAMLAKGLESEVRSLSQKFSWDTEPMKAIGYREWREYFDGSQTLELTRQRIIAGTRRLAKKQRTWFKRNNSIHWFSNRDEAVEFATTILNK
jgi:tRNA dimethylallyltransferase